ncbi:chorismate synthase, partial [Bacillus subtilis subsp. spizizenii ATCC 6633 = JCM 2499]|nr:chorismate synthase [Bacillus spizizenii ATCC 6633 = JCM 2499]
PAASVVAEAAVGWEIANAVVEHFGLDQIDRIRENVENMRKLSREL